MKCFCNHPSKSGGGENFEETNLIQSSLTAQEFGWKWIDNHPAAITNEPRRILFRFNCTKAVDNWDLIPDERDKRCYTKSRYYFSHFCRLLITEPKVLPAIR